ncbi:MAG: hypothetical protein AB7G39_13590 [Alphaproteobacteria bacterium]
MFHTYVLNARRVPIDIDRAIFLMDKALWQKVIGEAAKDGQTDPQEIWGDYCERHREKYGAPFAPNIRETPL